MAGVTEDDEFSGVPFIGEKELDSPVSAKVSVIVDFYGATEIGTENMGFDELKIPGFVRTVASWWLKPAIKDSGYDNVESAWLRRDTAQMTQEELAQVSPAYYVEKNLGKDSDLYILIRHGDVDLDVPYPQSQRLCALFRQTLGESKVDMELKHNYNHASDQFYTDGELGKLKVQLDHCFGS